MTAETKTCTHDNRLGFPGLKPGREMAALGFPPPHWWCPDCGHLYWYDDYDCTLKARVETLEAALRQCASEMQDDLVAGTRFRALGTARRALEDA